MNVINKLEANFVWIIILFSAIALFYPTPFIFFKPYITLFLAIIMFGIGYTLDLKAFKDCWQHRWIIILAAIVKYLLMPLTAFIIAHILRLPLYDVIGLIVVSTCPGGTAANVMSYLAKANVALTVILTFGTTLLAPLLMPSLVYLFLHKEIQVPFLEMVKNILEIVTLPLIIGLILKRLLGAKAHYIKMALPLVSIFAIAIIVACIMALSHSKILEFPLLIIIAVLLLNSLGYVYGYLFGKITKLSLANTQAIVFEYGMQDSGLGVIIANSFFGPASALASALYSLIQNITAPILIKVIYKRKLNKILDESR